MSLITTKLESQEGLKLIENLDFREVIRKYDALESQEGLKPAKTRLFLSRISSLESQEGLKLETRLISRR